MPAFLLPTQAGSTFLTEVRPLPKRDSALVARLRELGAVAHRHGVPFAAADAHLANLVPGVRSPAGQLV